MRSLAVIAVVGSLLAACSSVPDPLEEANNWPADKIYTAAHTSLGEGAFDKAIKLYEKLESRYPYGQYAQQAQLEQAYAYYKQGETASAVAACDRFLKLHPNHATADYAYYLKGLANFNEDLGLLGSISDQDLTERDPKAAQASFAAFKELVTRYPESKYAPEATQRMSYLVNSLAAHDVHVARYYLNRGAYLAAANRAQAVVKSYSGAPATEDALIILIKSYEAIGSKDLRDDAERVLKQNFPKTTYTLSAETKVKAWWKMW